MSCQNKFELFNKAEESEKLGVQPCPASQAKCLIGDSLLCIGLGVHTETTIGMANSAIMAPKLLSHPGTLDLKCSVAPKTGLISITSSGGSHFTCLAAAPQMHLQSAQAVSFWTALLAQQDPPTAAPAGTADISSLARQEGHRSHPAVLDCSLHLATALERKVRKGAARNFYPWPTRP